MIKFPSNAIVNIPPGSPTEGQNFVSVRLDRKTIDIQNLKNMYGNRLLNFEIINGAYDDSTLLESLEGMRVLIHIRDDLSGIGAHVNELRLMQPVFVIDPEMDAVRKINFFTAFNFPVRINTSVPPAQDDILEDVLDFYLHNPLLSVPVEPFHTLLLTFGNSREFNLWDIEKEKVNLNYFLGNDGKITLSSRWYEQGLYFGDTDGSWDEIINSKTFRRVTTLENTLFQEESPCIFCSHYHLCRGFFKAIDPEWACGSWKKVFSILVEEMRKARLYQIKEELE